MKYMRVVLLTIVTLAVSVAFLPGISWAFDFFYKSVHGINFQAQNPERVQGTPYGWGKEFKGNPNSSVWFHVAVPFGDDTGDVDILSSVVLNFKTAGYTFLKKVDVWSGPRKIASFGNLEESGDFTGGNVIVKRKHYGYILSKSGKAGSGGPLKLKVTGAKGNRVINYGVNISILVEFGPPKVMSGKPTVKPKITFYQAMIVTGNYDVAD